MPDFFCDAKKFSFRNIISFYSYFSVNLILHTQKADLRTKISIVRVCVHICACAQPCLDDRHLELEFRDANKASDSLIGFGMIDLDSILQNSKQKKPQPIRILLNYEAKLAGVIYAELEFMKHPIRLLSFRVERFILRRKPNDTSSDTLNCYARITIGGEVLKTMKKKDTLQMPPSWTDKVLTINVPKVFGQCLIEVIDDSGLVGECVLKVEDLLKQTKEKNYDVDIFYKGLIVGTLKFQTIIGEKAQFSLLDRDYKNKTEVKKEEPKPQSERE